MEQHPDYRPRLNVEVRPDQKAALTKLMPSRTTRAVFEVIVDNFLMMLRKDPEGVVGAILSRDLKLENILKLSVRCDHCGKTTSLRKLTGAENKRKDK